MLRSIFTTLLATACLTAPLRADEEAERIRGAIQALEHSLVQVHYTYDKVKTQVEFMLEDSRGGTRESQGEGICAGLVIDDQGLILVGGHIFPDPFNKTMGFGNMITGQSSSPPKSFEIITSDGTHRPARLLARDEGLNIAYLKVDDPPADLRPTPFDFEAELQVGDPFLVVTFLSKKYEYQRSFDSGRITGIEPGEVRRFLQNAIGSFGGLDAQVDPNGAPVIALDSGRIVGVIARPGREAPSEMVTEGLSDKSASHSVRMTFVVAPTVPSILHPSAFQPALEDPVALLGERGWIGIDQLQPLTSSLARFFGREEGAGAIISLVGPGSPAEQIGLQVEDVLIELQGEPVVAGDNDDINLLQRRIRLASVGDVLDVKVLRDGEEHEYRVPVAKAPKSVYEAETAVDDVFGVTVAEVTYDLVQKKNLDPQDIGSVIVRKTPLAGWFSLAGLAPDDIVLGVNEDAITNIEDFRRVMKKVAEERDDEVLVRVKRDAETRFIKVRPEW